MKNKIESESFMSDYQFTVHDRIKQAEKKEDKTWHRKTKEINLGVYSFGTRMIADKESSTYSFFQTSL